MLAIGATKKNIRNWCQTCGVCTCFHFLQLSGYTTLYRLTTHTHTHKHSRNYSANNVGKRPLFIANVGRCFRQSGAHHPQTFICLIKREGRPATRPEPLHAAPPVSRLASIRLGPYLLSTR